MIGLASVLIWAQRPRSLALTIAALVVLWGGLITTLSQSSFAALLLGPAGAGLAALRRQGRRLAGAGRAGDRRGARARLRLLAEDRHQRRRLAELRHVGPLRPDGGRDRPRAREAAAGLGLGRRSTPSTARTSAARAARPPRRRTRSRSRSRPSRGSSGSRPTSRCSRSRSSRLLRGARGSPVRAAIAAGFFALVLHTWLYAAFLEDPVTWTLLALGTALALPPVVPERGRRGRGGGAQRPSPRAGRRGETGDLGLASQPLRAAGRARGQRRSRSRSPCSSGRSRAPIPTTTPTTTWSGAASCSTAWSRRSRPTPRRPSIRSTSRSAPCSARSSARARTARSCSSACSRTRCWCSAPTGSARRSSAAGRARWPRSSWPRARRSCSTRRAATSTPRSSRWSCGRACARRRGRAPWVLLVLAGLLRPEAWVLTGLAWLGTIVRAGRRARARPAPTALRPARAAAPLVATLAVIAAPAIWALTDLAVTGDPLHSLNATSELADELGRVRGLEHVPGLVRDVRVRHRPAAGGAAGDPRDRARRGASLGLRRAARAAGAVRRGRDHVRRHRRARALDPPALPHRARRRAVPVRGLRAARLHRARARPSLAAALWRGARRPRRWSARSA